jgi:sigma54-dependent transcription regulator
VAKSKEGLLFLDEVGELGLNEQAMMLRALENNGFLLRDDEEVTSDFSLIGADRAPCGSRSPRLFSRRPAGSD